MNMKINILNKEEKAFIRYCHAVLESSDTIEEVLEKMNDHMRDNK